MRAAPGRVLPAARNSCKPSYLLEKGADSCESMLDALGLDLFASQQQVINSTSSALSSKEKKALVAVLKQDVRSIVFAGPKDLSSLEAAGHEFEAALDFGWSWLSPIARLLLRLMQFFYSLVPQWGAAIFLLTVTVKVFLLYFTVKAYVSMRRMQQLKPEMDKIKERYKEDKQAQQKAMMDLYKRHKVNPLGGCLPMLIQMPIYFALYRTIYATPDLYQANLFLWINDLSKPDPYFILPILLAVIMFAQQKLSSVGDQQHKWLMMMLPVVFTALMLFLPSGLVFYILVNSALSILQQMYIYKRVPNLAVPKKSKG
jgi:YidC/Oxa1 family membrane protein insertase